ncbi:hypothetical protein [Streptomyces sp. 8L]|uniref:hypothetical protein n=1 Tax=Streptomyces sp. 8L TaxID=2877242 RepID=UPI001CD3D060|nr:hypothetical protein [Streptomyces sp. 8L]MCA1220879.1 hypothetical protein [Streptomyces sp. 8L]
MPALWLQVLHSLSRPGTAPDDDILARAAADIALREHPRPPASAEVVLEIARTEFAAVLNRTQAQAALDSARRAARHRDDGGRTRDG